MSVFYNMPATTSMADALNAANQIGNQVANLVANSSAMVQQDLIYELVKKPLERKKTK